MVRISLRMWRRGLLLTGQFSATIAIGMGGATALVSLLLALGYQPLPYRDPARPVAIWQRAESGAVMGISGPDLVDFGDATHSIFATLGAFVPAPLWVLDTRGATRITASYIQASVFSNLGIHPVLGREVRPDDEPLADTSLPSRAFPAWIGYEFWQSRYGGSPSVIGATIKIGVSVTEQGDRLRIVGVLPRHASIPLPFFENTTDLWYLMERNSAARPRDAASFFGLGRLRPGVSAAQAEAALAVETERLGQRYRFDRHKRPVVQSLEAIAQSPARQTMGLLVLGVGLVFLVGCVNLAILMGVEGRRRQHEIAIRAALGAGRWRLWREVAAEKCILALLSLVLGAASAPALLRVLAWLVPAAGLGPPLEHPPPLNVAILFGFAAFAMAVALVWSALLAAAATTDGRGASRALSTSGGPGYTGLSDRSPQAGRWWLILPAAQAGTGICLLAAAAMTVGAYATRSTANLGPNPSHTLLLSVNPPDNIKTLAGAQMLDFNQQVLSRLERVPGVQAIGLADPFPPVGDPVPFVKPGDAADTERAATYPMSVSPGYFRTLGIPILYGRGFDNTDNLHGEKVAIISLDMAQKNWTSPKEAVGSQINYGSKLQNRYKIAGVAANFTGYWSQKPFPMVYLPDAQSANWCCEVILRTAASKRSVAAIAPRLLAGMAIPATISDVSTMQARWQATLTRPLARMAGMLLIGLLGLALCVQGVYAVAAGTVAARSHELAVRSALGGSPGRLAWNVTRELVFAVMAGAGLGIAAALVLRPLLERWLGPAAVWRAEPIAAAVVLLGMAAAAGCWVPVRAAMRANPADLLRQG